MQIPIQTTVASITATQPIEADSVNADILTLDASKRDAGPMSLKATLTPFLSATPNLYSSVSMSISASDVNAAAANIPELGIALQSIAAAMPAVVAYVMARGADVAMAKQALQAATQAIPAAQDAESLAFAARGETFAQCQANPDDQVTQEALAAPMPLGWLRVG